MSKEKLTRAEHIRFEYEGKDYELFFTKQTVKSLENSGFELDDVKNKAMNAILDLFSASFDAKYRFVKRSKREEIYFKLVKSRKTDEDGTAEESLIDRLMELYLEPYNELFGNYDDEDDENLISWS